MPNLSLLKSKICACNRIGVRYIRGGWACERCLKFEEAYYGDDTDGRKKYSPHKQVPKDSSERQPRPGEITAKEWKLREHQRTGHKMSTIAAKFARDKYPGLQVRRVTKHCCFVKEI